MRIQAGAELQAPTYQVAERQDGRDAPAKRGGDLFSPGGRGSVISNSLRIPPTWPEGSMMQLSVTREVEILEVTSAKLTCGPGAAGAASDQAIAGTSAQTIGLNCVTGIKNISLYGIGTRYIRKGVIPVSGKSPKNGGNKKAGKSILEKRADKRAKSELSDLSFTKPRKHQR